MRDDIAVEMGTPSLQFAESDLADKFCEQHGEELRYVAKWGRWMRYVKGCWHEEETLLAFDLARKICDGLTRGSNRANKDLKSAKTFAAIERIAKADRRIAATVNQWDTDLWILNTPKGVVDLKTGKVRKHKPEDYLTKMTAAAPGGTCPLWMNHLKRITNGDDELVNYLQVMSGYTLTGETREHNLLYGHGTGRNGKGTTTGTLKEMMNDYAVAAPMQTFLVQNTPGHPTDLAMLRGARMVVASEVEEGQRWDENRIKMMTGGDPITARFMRQDFFTYKPQFKLWLSGNHKPSLRSVDVAIRSRFHLVPFTVEIPEAERDKELMEKLKGEWPGILAWAIDGCLLWQRNGLIPPPSVRAATDEYLAAEDTVTQWFADCCEASTNAKGLFTSELFNSWKSWAEEAGEFVGSQKRFSQRLEDRKHELGIEKVWNLHRDASHGNGFRGMKFREVRQKF